VREAAKDTSATVKHDVKHIYIEQLWKSSELNAKRCSVWTCFSVYRTICDLTFPHHRLFTDRSLESRG